MRTDRHAALKLRLLGKSYTEISRDLGVPKSTLSSWFASLVLSTTLREQIAKRGRVLSTTALIVRNKAQTRDAQRRNSTIRKTAADRFRKITQHELFVVGLALYWAEGYKRPTVVDGKEPTAHVVSLTNSDPLLIRMFLRFLRECHSVPNERIRMNLRIFPHQNSGQVQRFWVQTTDIAAEKIRITKVQPRSQFTKRPFSRLLYGVAQIRVGDTK